MTRSGSVFVLAAGSLVACASPAWGHPTGAADAGVLAAALHPWTGADHLIAAVGAGILSAQLGTNAYRTIPALYAAGLALGAFGAATGWAVASIELFLALSVLGLGILICMPTRLPGLLVLSGVTLFAAFHGYAHQSEIAGTTLLESAAFVSATVISIVAASASARYLRGRIACPIDWAGVPVTLSGILLTGLALG